MFARQFAGLRQWGWVAYCVTSAVAGFVLGSAAVPAQDFRLMFAGGALTWIWAAAIAAQLRIATVGTGPARS